MKTVGNEAEKVRAIRSSLFVILVMIFCCIGIAGCGNRKSQALSQYWAADSEAAAIPVDTEAILSLFKKSFAPSQIDKRLRLATGTAHDVIVESWAADSRRGKNSRKAEKALDLFGEHRCA